MNIETEDKEAIDRRPEMSPEPAGNEPEPAATQEREPDPHPHDEGGKRGLIYRIKRFFRSLRKGSRNDAESPTESTTITGTSPA